MLPGNFNNFISMSKSKATSIIDFIFTINAFNCHLVEILQKHEAAKALSTYLESGDGVEKMTDKKTWADNLNHIVAAIGKQAETRMMLSGIMAKDEEEKIALMRRKQSLEERKERQDAAGSLGIVLDEKTEELAQ